MKKQEYIGLDFIIDKLTNSIENTSTGELFDTEIIKITSLDTKQIKKANWQFDWHNEFKDKTKEIYKLTTVNYPTIIQILLSIEDKQDHIFMHLIESAKFNKRKRKSILAYLEILLLTPAKFQWTRAMKAFLLLTQNQR